MAALFRGWDHERLATIYSMFEPDESVCSHCLRYNPISRLKPKLTLREHLTFWRRKRFPFDENVWKWAKRFSPEVIYTYALGNYVEYIKLAVDLSRVLKTPYVVHVMDDWPERLRLELLAENRSSELEDVALFWQNLFDEAAGCLSISAEMSAEYQIRYSNSFEPFSNAVDMDQWQSPDWLSTATEPKRLVYVGAVSEEKELEALALLRDALKQLRTFDQDYRLDVYSSDMWRSNIESHLLGEDKAVRFCGQIGHDELPELLGNAGILVLALNDNEVTRSYLGLSIQNKVPEYMASGTPVLVMGPKGNPSVEYARRENWGQVVERLNVSNVAEAVRRLAMDKKLREQLSGNAVRIAKERHNREKIHTHFANTLSVASRWRGRG